MVPTFPQRIGRFISRVAKGDTAALHALYLEFSPVVHGVIRRGFISSDPVRFIAGVFASL